MSLSETPFSALPPPGFPSPDELALSAALAGVSSAFASLGRVFFCVDASFHVLHASSHLDHLLGKGAARRAEGRPLADLLGSELFGPAGTLRQLLLAGERREGWRSSLDRARLRRRALVSVTAAPFCAEPGAVCDPRVAYVIVLRPAEEDQIATASPFPGLIGRSSAIVRIFRLIENLEHSETTVLLTGESGTGKEVVAHAIHARSPRRAGPFVAVNCGALPGELLESELFGHVRGAFTGAVRDRAGRFELAAGGTLFLDEVADLPLHLQVKLLRVLQERTFERVGESAARTSDARIVAATHVDLRRAVQEGRFREDLYYRLRVVPIEIPPLRDRREDIEPLATFLLARVGARQGRALRFSPDVLRLLLEHSWPGNVRELENALEYAVAVCKGQTILPEDLPGEVLARGRRSRCATPAAAAAPGAAPRRPTNAAADRGGRDRRGAHPGCSGSLPLEAPRGGPGPRRQPHHTLAPHARARPRVAAIPGKRFVAMNHQVANLSFNSRNPGGSGGGTPREQRKLGTDWPYPPASPRPDLAGPPRRFAGPQPALTQRLKRTFPPLARALLLRSTTESPMNHVSRRRFLKITGTGAGVAAAAGAFGLASRGPAGLEGPGREGDPHRPHLLRPLLLEVQRDRDGPGRRSLEGRGQPRRPPLPRPPLPARHGRRRRPLRPRPPARPAPARERPRRGEVDRGHLGRGAGPRRREDAEDQGGARPGGGRPLQPRHRRDVPEAHPQGLRLAELRRAVVRPVPRPARRGLRADLRRGDRLARAHGHRERPLPRPPRLAPRREHAQHPGAGVRRGGRPRRDGHRGRPALLDRGEQGPALPADRAGDRPRAPPRLDERAGGRGALRPGVRRRARLRLRGLRRRDRPLHPGVGVPRDRHRAGGRSARPRARWRDTARPPSCTPGATRRGTGTTRSGAARSRSSTLSSGAGAGRAASTSRPA